MRHNSHHTNNLALPIPKYHFTHFVLCPVEGIISDVDQLLLLPLETRIKLLEPLSLATGASTRKTAKYLHLKIEKSVNILPPPASLRYETD